MIFTTKNKRIEDIDININGVNICRVYATKFLGVQIDSRLNWKAHVEYTCKKLSKCVGILAKARKKLHRSTLVTLYYSFAFPYFIYCNHVWGNTYQANLQSLKLVQKKLVRIIHCAPYKAHTGPLMYASKMLTIEDINVYITGIYMYQCLKLHCPTVFNNFFIKNSRIHDHNTRQSIDIRVPYAKLNIRKSSIRIHGANTWNNIPESIKQAPSLNVFKLQLRTFLIDSRLLS